MVALPSPTKLMIALSQSEADETWPPTASVISSIVRGYRMSLECPKSSYWLREQLGSNTRHILFWNAYPGRWIFVRSVRVIECHLNVPVLGFHIEYVNSWVLIGGTSFSETQMDLVRWIYSGVSSGYRMSLECSSLESLYWIREQLGSTCNKRHIIFWNADGSG
jgi:hypothetical protein